MKRINRVPWLLLVVVLASGGTGCGPRGAYSQNNSGSQPFLDVLYFRYAPVRPPGGAIVTMQKAPLAFSGRIPDAVPSARGSNKNPEGAAVIPGRAIRFNPQELKCGTAEATRIAIYSRLLSVGWGDASIKTAARRAGITRVQFADYELCSILGIVSFLTVYVYGE